MIVDELEGCVWRRAGILGVDGATVGFIDAGAIAEFDTGRRPIAGPSGIEMLVGAYRGVMAVSDDGEYDVEIVRDVDGEVAAVRVEFVTDVAELDGEWSDWQDLEITSGRLLVCDPFCAHNSHYRLVLPLRSGTHRMQSFVAPGEGFLGMRLIATP